jgi:hypothetical protein
MTEVAVTSALPGRAEAMLADRFELRVHRGATLTGVDELAAANVIAVLDGGEPPTPVVRGR